MIMYRQCAINSIRSVLARVLLIVVLHIFVTHTIDVSGCKLGLSAELVGTGEL